MSKFIKTKEQSREHARTAIESFTTHGGHYLSMRLNGNFRWPSKFSTMSIMGYEILLWPRTNWDQPGLVIKCRGDGKEEAKFAFRFLSGIAWESGESIQHEGFWVHGNRINPCFLNEEKPHNPYAHEAHLDEHDYIPLPLDDKSQIALAFYREALSLNNESYAFLSLAKILNIKFSAPKDQIKWINENLHFIKQGRAKERLDELSHSEADVGNYLYASGRCAVAHAYATPLVNPDDPSDIRRLSSDLPVIKALAEIMIEREFGVKSSLTIYKEHHYELAGFKNILGQELVEKILNENVLTLNKQENVKQIQNALSGLSVRLRGFDEKPFENLNVTVMDCRDGKLFLYCHENNHLVSVGLALDFKEERLLFDPHGGFSVEDDGSAEAALRMSNAIKFNWYLFANGVLEIWKQSNLLGRLDAYLPVNIILSPYEKTEIQVQSWQRLAISRIMSPKSHVEELRAIKLNLLGTSNLAVTSLSNEPRITKEYDFTISQSS